MQRLMYRDCFYVYMDVPEELQQYPVPQMILHTFLENIFKHVISIDSFTTVLIQALWSFSGKEVYLKLELYISQGQFSQEILDFVNKDMEITEKKDGSGIGIKNVKEVLKMMYEQDHLLYLENLEPEGTKIDERERIQCRMNLLIVDDEIVTTQVLEEQLDRALLSIDQIYVAYNTSMARDILQKNKVELILCDIEMPKENGIHFLEWVREQKIQTEVIFLTGKLSAEAD